MAFALGAAGKLLTPTTKKVRLAKPSEYTNLPTRLIPLIHLNISILRWWCRRGLVPDGIPVELIHRVAARVTDDRRVFTNLQVALRTCVVPEGLYAQESGMVYTAVPGAPGEVVGVYYGG